MYSIQKIKRKNLNLEKYSKAINEALNYRIYAEYWYLDILTEEKWECWIWGDYEAVMPIPLQYKFGFKFVLQPIYCQQLGVFYKEEIPDDLFREFERKLHQYRVRSYCFNEENTERYDPKGEKKVNYILDLNRPYEEIKKNLSKSSKWNSKQFEKSGLSVELVKNHNSLISFKEKHSPVKVNKDVLSNLFKKIALHKLELTKCVMKDKEINAYAYFALSKKRIIYINSASNEMGRKICAPTGILLETINSFSEKSYFLDFEGSTNPKLGNFFRGFGAEKNFYTHFNNFRF